MRKGPCPKCSSSVVIEGGRIFDHFQGAVKSDLAVTVYERPEAWLFKGAVATSLRAWVCGSCGYTELYVENPKTLVDALGKQELPG
jgi:ribosomal protein S27AE